MKKQVLTICILLINLSLFSQNTNDSILANERKIDRPLTLHRGQLQIKPAYNISILSKEYGSEGNKIDLTTKGTASVLHQYLFELNYGILNFVQATIALNYAKRGERNESILSYSTATDPYFYLSYFDSYKGFEDIYFGTILKIPIKSKKFEFAIAPGIYLPLFSNEPKQPEHSIIMASAEQEYTKINYHNHYKFGNGATALKFGVLTIIRTSDNFSISAQLNYSAPLSESESVNWIHQLNGTSFEYEKVSYKYLIGNSLDYEINLGYQAISWFNIWLSYKKRKLSKGWDEKPGLRVGNLEKKLSLISIGYEIKITSKFWMSQFLDIPVGGKNQLATFSIYSGIYYNLYTNKR